MTLAGAPVRDIARELGIERKTVIAISEGRHQFQAADSKYRRCDACGAISERARPCGCQQAITPTAAPETILDVLARHTYDEAPVPEPGDPPRSMPAEWLLGQIIGRPGVGKTRIARSWWPGASSLTQPPPRDVVGLWLAGSYAGRLAAVAAVCRLVGLGRSAITRTIGELSESELERLLAARGLLTRRRVVVLDPWLTRCDDRDRRRIARRLRSELAGGELDPGRVVLVGGRAPLPGVDWCYEIQRDGRILRRRIELEQDRRRAWRALGRDQGRCLDCHRPAEQGRVRCHVHLAAQRG